MDTERLVLARWRALHFLADQRHRPVIIDPQIGFNTADLDILIQATDQYAPYPRQSGYYDHQLTLL